MCEECGEAEAEGWLLEVDETVNGHEALDSGKVLSDPESDEDMVEGHEATDGGEDDEYRRNGH